MLDARATYTPLPPNQTELLLLIPSKVTDGLERMARDAGMKAGLFTSHLLVAAYSARIKDVGDHVLEAAVRGDLNGATPAPVTLPDEARREVGRLRLENAELNKEVSRLRIEKTQLAEDAKDAIVGRATGAALNRASGQVSELKAKLTTLEAMDRTKDRKIADLEAVIAELQEAGDGMMETAEANAARFLKLEEQAQGATAKALTATEDAKAARNELRLARLELTNAGKKQVRLCDERDAAQQEAARLKRLMEGSAPPLHYCSAPATGAQAEADALDAATVRIVNGYYDAGRTPFDIAKAVNVSVEAVRILVKATLSRAQP